MAASFFFMFSTMFVNPLINGYAKNLGASSAFAGVIVGIMSVAAMFLRPIAGNLTDKFSKYRLSFIGGVFDFNWCIRLCLYAIKCLAAFIQIDQWYRLCFVYRLYDNLAGILGAAAARGRSNGFLWFDECLSNGFGTGIID